MDSATDLILYYVHIHAVYEAIQVYNIIINKRCHYTFETYEIRKIYAH